MTNIDLIGRTKILEHIPKNKKYRLLEEEETVRMSDLICMVSISSLHNKEFIVTWNEPEKVGEINRPRKHSGQIVIREIELVNDGQKDRDTKKTRK